MIVKKATEPWEFEQIFRLNYDTFVEEIPQHPENQDKKLMDYVTVTCANECLAKIKNGKAKAETNCQ